MSGPKTNERPGTRAQGRYLKGSASKARRVLNLIRNESVEDARTILQFSETGGAVLPRPRSSLCCKHPDFLGGAVLLERGDRCGLQGCQEVVGRDNKTEHDNAESDPLPASALSASCGSAFLHVFAPSWLRVSPYLSYCRRI